MAEELLQQAYEEYEATQDFTVAVEEEFAILDAETLSLTNRYEDLKAVLNVHLRREVTEVMPVVDRVLTEKELQEGAKHGIDQLDKKFLVGYLGMVLATNPPADRRELFKEIPPPIRLAYRLIGRRMYRKQYSKLFPGREAPETL